MDNAAPDEFPGPLVERFGGRPGSRIRNKISDSFDRVFTTGFDRFRRALDGDDREVFLEQLLPLPNYRWRGLIDASSDRPQHRKLSTCMEVPSALARLTCPRPEHPRPSLFISSCANRSKASPVTTPINKHQVWYCRGLRELPVMLLIELEALTRKRSAMAQVAKKRGDRERETDASNRPKDLVAQQAKGISKSSSAALPTA
jgi:hypothetical protein